MLENRSNKLKCFLCESKFWFGEHQYEGHFIREYGFMACKKCVDANWDGLSPIYEEKVLDHLKANNLPIPQRNSKGWYPAPVWEGS